MDIHEDGGYSSSDFDGLGNSVNDISQDLEDPHYKMFLENLVENGNSYALVVHPENDEPEVLNYEILDRLPDVSRLETPKAIESRPENCKTNKGIRIMREVSDGMANFSSEEVVWSERSLRYRVRNEKKGILKPSDDVPVKRRKSSSAVRKAYGGTSRGFKRRSGSAGCRFVEEEEDTCEDDIRLVKRRKSSSAARKASGGTSGGSRRRSSAKGNSFVEEEDDASEKYIRFFNLGCCGTSGGSSGRPRSKGNDFSEYQVDREVEIDSGDESYLRQKNPHHDRASGPSYAEPGSDGCHIYELESDGTDDADSEYMEYLDLLEAKGEDVMYRDDSPHRFDEVEESETDSDILVTDVDPFGGGNCTPFVSSQPSHIDLDDYSVAEDFSMASRAQYKKKLIEILKRPYDSKQHDCYMQEVQCHKPILEEKNLRSKTKRYPSKTKFAKSYLDQYADFAELIDLAKNDKRKSLNLLRGFFYWIKYMSHAGMFQPWKDPSILEVLPQN